MYYIFYVVYTLWCRHVCLQTYFLVALRPNAGHGLLILEGYRSHTTTHHSRYDTSGRMIGSSKRSLPDNTHNNHNRHTSMPPTGFEPTISAGERPQTYALDRMATGTGGKHIIHSFSSLSYDRSKASSKATSPHSAIQSSLFQMRVSSPFLKVIQ